MEKQLIKRINGVDIFAESTEEGIFVPIKPICTALGIADRTQRDKIQEDDILSSVGTLRVSTGADGKEYEMFCLPLKYIYGWLFTINPKNVAPEAKEKVTAYRRECYDALYGYFNDKIQKTNVLNKAEIDILEKLRKKLEEQKEVKNEIKVLEKNLDDIRRDRLNPNKSLFDDF